MKIARLVGLALVAVFAMSAIIASTASAFPEFLMLPTGKTFTGVSGVATLVAGTEKVTCQKDTNTGEVTSMDSIGKVTVHFLECKGENGKAETCTVKSAGAPETTTGLIITNSLRGLLGEVAETEAKSKVGILLEPESGVTFVTLQGPCLSPTEEAVEGTVAGELTPIKALQSTLKLILGVTSKKQNIKEITVLAGLKKPKLTAFGIATATEETEDENTFEGKVEVC
jgi:hypothetical protein